MIEASKARETTSLVDVPRGVFVFRYAEAAQPEGLIIVFSPAVGSAHLLDFLQAPDASALRFQRPGEFIVVASKGDARLHISVRATRPGSSLEARLELENLDRAAAPTRKPVLVSSGDVRPRGAWPEAAGHGQPVHASNVDLTVVGHVARRGDVSAAVGEWIAGPMAPAPIEGFVLKGMSASYLEAQVMLAGEAAWTSWRPASQFVGTLGRGRPLTGVRLRMSAHAPHDVEIEASALFLGSPVHEQSGARVELRSAAGSDPLVGLKLNLRWRGSGAVRGSTSAMNVKGRVRVFRAGVERLSA